MKPAEMNEIRHGRRPLTAAHVEDLLTEARAVVAASTDPLREVVALRVLKLRLETAVFDQVRSGSKPLTAEIIDELFADIRTAIAEAPGPITAALELFGATGGLMYELAGKRGLLRGVEKRVAEEAGIVRPPGAPAAITEREAIQQALGL